MIGIQPQNRIMVNDWYTTTVHSYGIWLVYNHSTELWYMIGIQTQYTIMVNDSYTTVVNSYGKWLVYNQSTELW